jgi:soluble cytochrome b562
MQKLLLALLLLSPFATIRAQPAPGAPPAGQEETELDGKMNALRGAFNKLRKQVSDPAANASSLELVAKLRKAAEEAIALAPARAAEVPEADRARFIEKYQAGMKAFVAEVAKLETALKEGKNDEAAAIVAKLGAMQKEGHKEFRRAKP